MVSPILIGPLNFHRRPAKASGGVGRHGPAEEPRLDGQAEKAVGDPLAEDGSLHELGVGVEDVVVAGQSREHHDVRLGDRAAGRLVLLANRYLIKKTTRVRGHARKGYHTLAVPAPDLLPGEGAAASVTPA